MHVQVNNMEIDLDKGSSIEDAIKKANAPYSDDCVMTLIEGKEELESLINKYSIKTTHGTVIIEIMDDNPLVDVWRSQYKEFMNKQIRWTTSNEVSIGPIKTELKPSDEEYSYHRWDVLLSLSGFSNEATHIIFLKNNYKSVFSVPEGTDGVFAKVIGGKRTVTKITDDDEIISIEPIIERKHVIKTAKKIDLSTKLSEGNQLFTYLEVKADDEAPLSFEHFLKVIEDGKIHVDYESESFIGSYLLKGLEKESEKITKRNKATVTVRNRGKSVGNIYLYREDRVSSDMHNTLGYITKGIELLDTTKVNDKILVKTIPEKISTISLTQIEAENYLKEHDIVHIRDGLTSDGDIIVAQDPRYTLDIVEKKELKTLGVKSEEIIHIELYDDASPNSVWYFKKITGLLDGDIGHLQVKLAIKDMDIIMFKEMNREAKGLIPEKTTEDMIKAYEVCVSNTACKNVGNIGIRFKDNNDFGPTGESLKSTNIIGHVIFGQENLKNFKEGDTVYVTTKKSS
ncbi:MAG: methanogenesis marker 3 protein [Methanobacteriaceae archaeon]|nr:methanogenesis marker 3 protein [Methanobacteriaceae archaeon]